MTDLTKITTAFGLLDEETQEALKECGGPWQIYCTDGRWRDFVDLTWLENCVCRKKPQPVVEQVVLYGRFPKLHNYWGFSTKGYDKDTHMLTLTRVDGKIDCASARLEEI